MSVRKYIRSISIMTCTDNILGGLNPAHPSWYFPTPSSSQPKLNSRPSLRRNPQQVANQWEAPPPCERGPRNRKTNAQRGESGESLCNPQGLLFFPMHYLFALLCAQRLFNDPPQSAEGLSGLSGRLGLGVSVERGRNREPLSWRQLLHEALRWNEPLHKLS